MVAPRLSWEGCSGVARLSADRSAPRCGARGCWVMLVGCVGRWLVFSALVGGGWCWLVWWVGGWFCWFWLVAVGVGVHRPQVTPWRQSVAVCSSCWPALLLCRFCRLPVLAVCPVLICCPSAALLALTSVCCVASVPVSAPWACRSLSASLAGSASCQRAGCLGTAASSHSPLRPAWRDGHGWNRSGNSQHEIRRA